MAAGPQEIFEHAVGLGEPARDEYLRSACGADDALRAEVVALLRAHDGDPAPPTEGADAATMAAPPREHEGQLIGRYKLLQPIGEGGFGAVWMAEQREPVKRRVALKIIKLGMDTRQVIARFEAERQALALMDHPNIARVLDAGSTETGRPYFVMEYIKGVPILEYCDRERLDTKARLDLFMKVCQAIQHAHQKGIIHRDIKPSNVLLTMHDGLPVPKVIDFGIAKATHSELTQKTLFTEHRHMVGTPAYMSPEQAEMSGLDIDTRSDVYSLGVLLYELLTGTTPFDTSELLSKGFAEMMRIIREVEPHKPSTRLSTLGQTATKTAQQRHADVHKLSTILKGDLDWIVMKCLEKDRSRRYETANGLAADIQRHLNDEPVFAGPPSARYKLSKFVKRNRAGVITVCLVGLAVLAGAVGTAWGLVLAARSNAALTRSRAAVQARYELAVDAVKTFHTGVSGDFLLQQDQFKDLRDGLLTSASDFYEKLGALLRDADDLPSRRSLLQANYELAELADMVGRREDALALHRRVLQGREEIAALPGADRAMSMDVAHSLVAVGGILEQTGQTDEALVMFERARATAAAGDGGPPRDPAGRSIFAKAEQRAGLLLSKIGRTDEALRAIERAGTLLASIAAADPEDTDKQLALASCRDALGTVLGPSRRAEALVVFEEACAIRQRLADAHPDAQRVLRELSSSHLSIGKTFYFLGKADEALRALGKAHAITRRLADANPAVLQHQFDLQYIIQHIGHVHRTTGRLAEALRDEESAFAILSKLVEASPTVTQFQAHLAGSYNNIGLVLSLMGRSAEAIGAQQKALAIRQKMADANPTVIMCQSDLAWCHDRIGVLLLNAQRPAEALASFEASLSINTRLARADLAVPSPPGEQRDDVASGHTYVADAQRALGRRAEARAGYEAAIALRETLVREYPLTPAYAGGLACSLRRRGLARLAEGDAPGAAADIRRALGLLEGLKKPESDDWFEMACCHATLSALAGREGAGSASEGSAEADEAVAVLARNVGMFDREPAAYRAETGLDPIRDRSDFVELMRLVDQRSMAGKPP